MSSTAATTFLPLGVTARIEKGSLVVSVHDVAPTTQQVAEKILTELAHRGVSVCSILVVPNYHHLGSSIENREFSLWLQELEARGHEIVIHGYFHERPRQPNEEFRARVVTRFYTNDEGEFYDLGYEEALLRITRARDEFQQIGLRPRGFIAPAWLLGNEGECAAVDSGLEYTTRLRTVRDFRSGKDFHSRTLVYSVRNRWRRAASLAWNGALLPVANQKELMRLSIHPPDFGCGEVWRQILRVVGRVIPSRKVMTYAGWLDEERVRDRNSN
ncbi:MAG: polysaccharide deacetylase family protein [Verrucomicrobiota bacterium]